MWQPRVRWHSGSLAGRKYEMAGTDSDSKMNRLDMSHTYYSHEQNKRLTH